MFDDLLAGKDRFVVLWSIQDHISSLATDTAAAKSSSKVSGSNEKPMESPEVGARGVFQGHDDTVEDVTFCPSKYLTSHLFFCCPNIDVFLKFRILDLGSS